MVIDSSVAIKSSVFLNHCIIDKLGRVGSSICIFVSQYLYLGPPNSSQLHPESKRYMNIQTYEVYEKV